MKAVLLIDFGSTYTKITAVDVEKEKILGTAQSFTTIETDINDGLNNALAILKEQIGEIEFSERYACSSAAGGLRMVAIGLVPELTARIVFEPEYRDPNALVGLEGYSHLWLIWQFSTVAAEYAAGKSWRPTVRPPRLGGNARRGVFATRSPYRPNALGLSCVELSGIENGDILVKGADLLDGTPIFDIKPYLPYVDAHPEARGGFTEQTAAYALEVQCPQLLLDKLPENKRAALLGVLKNDPRPAYQHDPDRVYAMDFGGYRVQFQVGESMLTVIDIQK